VTALVIRGPGALGGILDAAPMPIAGFVAGTAFSVVLV